MHSRGNAIGRVHTKRSEDYCLSDATVPIPPDVQYFCSTMVENKLAHERNSFRRGMIIPNMYNTVAAKSLAPRGILRIWPHSRVPT